MLLSGTMSSFLLDSVAAARVYVIILLFPFYLIFFNCFGGLMTCITAYCTWKRGFLTCLSKLRELRWL